MARRVLVVGAGVTGLAAAVLLARRGATVDVLSRDRGGLAGAVAFRGVPCDLGSHRMHAGALSLPLMQEMAGDVDLRTRPRRGVLVMGHHRVPYPPTVRGLVRALGARASLGVATGWVRTMARWHRDRMAQADAGFEDFITRRVGVSAYRDFYAPAADKVWGMAPGEISQSVARLRLSTSDPWALIRGPARRTADKYLYPAGGFGAVTAWLHATAVSHGVTVRLGAAWEPALAHDYHRVVYTGLLRDLVPTPLAHRGVYLVFMALGMAEAEGPETWYLPETGYWPGRVANVGAYAPGRVPPHETVLCLEIPEGRWGLDRDFTHPAAVMALREQLARAGIVPAGVALHAIRQVWVPDVYPVYRRGWRAEWDRAVTAAAKTLPAVIPVGRQGLFLHCNTDHCVAQAMDVVDHVLADGTARAWRATAEGYLSLTVRD